MNNGGVVGTGLQYRQQALGLMGKAGDLQTERKSENAMMKAAKMQNIGSAVGTGASIGMMAGMQAGSVGGPMGAGIGAGIGLLAGVLL